MSKLGNQNGASLVEVLVTLAISAVLIVPLFAMFRFQVGIPIKIRSELKSSQQIQKSTLLLTEDSSVARSFTPGVEPDYGTFSSLELSGKSAVPVTARYFWKQDPDHPKGYGDVFRELDRNGEVTPPQLVITGVRQYGDIVLNRTAPVWTFDHPTKSWSYTEGRVGVSVISTHEAGAVYAKELPETVFTASLVSDFRPQTLLPAPLPARLPPPAPVPNQISFRIAGNPTLLKGSLKSGTGVDLTYDDSKHYVVAATGSPRTASWEATSEAIDYTSISSGTVSFTGQTSKAGVSLEVFVFNPTDPEHTAGGYALAPDAAVTYSSSGTDLATVFNLSEADIAYINTLSPKVVKVKVNATHTTLFDLSGDQLVFTVGGTPAPTFFRDYLVESDPAIEVGSYVSGSNVNLETDDTGYYVVKEVNNVAQWTAVSQGITLDTISSIEVIFLGRASKGKPIQQIFVFNPSDPVHTDGGFAATADSQLTYAVTNTDTTHSFFLSSADIAYVVSLFPKEVRIRLKGTDTTVGWTLEADRLVFRVKP